MYLQSKINKIIELLDRKDKELVNDKIIFLVKDVGASDYIDYEGNSVSDAIKKYSIVNSKGKRLPPNIVLIDIIDNSYLEKYLYQ